MQDLLIYLDEKIKEKTKARYAYRDKNLTRQKSECDGYLVALRDVLAFVTNKE